MDWKRIWGWWSFDWASQPYFTLGLTFVFGPYFASVATESYMAAGLDEQAADAQAQAFWAQSITWIGLGIAISAPFLGALADTAGRRRPWILTFSLFYVLGAAGLWFTMPDGSNLLLAVMAFGIGLIGAEFATVFTNAMLPGLAPRESIGKISGIGFALGYAGGVIALIVMLLLFAEGEGGTTLLGLSPALGLDPEMREGTRFVGPFMALWFMVFMIPFVLWVREEPAPRHAGGASRALRQLWQTITTLPQQPSLSAYLASSMLYRDGLNALYSFGGTYALLVLNWQITQVGIFGVIGAVSAALACWVGGHIDSARGPKPLIIAMIVLLVALCAFIPGLTPDTVWGVETGLVTPVFMVCGALIGAAGGVLQSASRTMMVRHAHPERAAEAFGLYALAGKATSFLGPMLITIATVSFGDARLGFIGLIVLFGLGLVLLIWVRADGEAHK